MVARVDAAPRGGQRLSLISWGEGQPFYAPVGDEIWVTMSRDVDPGDDEYRVEMVCEREKSAMLAGLAVELCSTFNVVSGGAWSPGGFWPSWADHRWKVAALAPPTVVGPLWLVVAPEAAHRLLADSEQARAMAVRVYPFPAGALWQLSSSCDGPLGDELHAWIAVMSDLGVWSGSPELP